MEKVAWFITPETEGVEKVASGLSLPRLSDDHKGSWHSDSCCPGMVTALMVVPT